jgi:hypothetical protein
MLIAVYCETNTEVYIELFYLPIYINKYCTFAFQNLIIEK